MVIYSIKAKASIQMCIQICVYVCIHMYVCAFVYVLDHIFPGTHCYCGGQKRRQVT